MMVNGIELLKMMKNNFFDDGDEIVAGISIFPFYKYNSHCANFINKDTKKELTIEDLLFWSFSVDKKYNIQKEDELNNELKEYFSDSFSEIYECIGETDLSSDTIENLQGVLEKDMKVCIKNILEYLRRDGYEN